MLHHLRNDVLLQVFFNFCGFEGEQECRLQCIGFLAELTVRQKFSAGFKFFREE